MGMTSKVDRHANINCWRLDIPRSSVLAMKQYGYNMETIWKQPKKEHEKSVPILNACVSKAALNFYVPTQAQLPATFFWPIAA